MAGGQGEAPGQAGSPDGVISREDAASIGRAAAHLSGSLPLPTSRWQGGDSPPRLPAAKVASVEAAGRQDFHRGPSVRSTIGAVWLDDLAQRLR